MRQCLPFISSLLAYWLPMLGGLLLLAFTLFRGSLSLGLCASIAIVIASLSRLAFEAAQKDAQDRAVKGKPQRAGNTARQE